MTRYTFLLISALFCVLGKLCSAADCPGCAKIAEQENHQEFLKRSRLAYVAQNQAYMAKHPDAELSARIKAQSNIVQARIQIETVENNLIFLKQDFDKRGCAECATTKGN